MVRSGNEQRGPQATGKSRGTWYVAGLLILFLFAWTLLLFRLDEVPPGFQHDQTFTSLDAMRVLGGSFPIYFPDNFGREPLFMYSVAGVFSITGGHYVWSLRFAAAIWGMLGLAATVVFARRHLSGGASLFAAALTAGSFWFLLAARLGLEPIALLPLALACFYFVDRGYSNHSLRDFAVAGLFAGVACYTYLAARTLYVLVPLLLVYEAVAALRLRIARQSGIPLAGGYVGGLLLAWGLMFLVSAPLLAYLGTHGTTGDARVRELGGPISAALRGNLQPAVRNAVDTLRSILWAGSAALPYQYNVPGRPVLQPVSAVLFVVGLVVTIWRVRDRREYLLLTALFLGIVPCLLTGADALYMRAIFALPLIFILVSRGLWAAGYWAQRSLSERWPQFVVRPWGSLRQRRGTPRPSWLSLMAGLVLAGLLCWHAVDSARAYFVTWAEAALTQRIYNADFRAAARYLDANPTNDEVFIGTDRLIDLDQSTYKFYEPARPDVNWFTLPQSPALPRDGNALYMLPARAAVPASLQFASEQSRPAAAAGSGSGQFWLCGPGDSWPVCHPGPRGGASAGGQDGQYEIMRGLRISAEDVQQALDAAGVRAPDSTVSFGDALRLDGIGLLDDGSEAKLVTAWTVLAPWPRSARPGYPFPQPKLAVSFTDRSGYKWAESDLVTSLPVQTWRPGQMVVEVTPIALPADILPGNYAVQLAMYDDEGGPLPMRDGSGKLLASPPATASLHVAQRRAGDAPSPPFAMQPRQNLGTPQASGEGDLRLLGWWESLDKIIAGVPTLVHASWQAVKPLDTAGLRFGLRAKSAAGDLLWEQPADPLIPLPQQWPAGQVYRVAHNVLPQSIPPEITTAELELCAYRRQTPLACGVLGQAAVLSRSPLLELPHPPQQQSGADFGGSLSLVGYDITKSGQAITLTLYWQAEAPSVVTLKRFVHAGDANGQIVAQSDVPADSLIEGVPEIYWRPGEYVVDRLALQIPAGKQVANLFVGLYDAVSGERLPVRMPNGDLLPDKRLTIPYQDEVQR